MEMERLCNGIVIWGAGEITSRVWPYIGEDNVIAIIDNSKQKIGKYYLGKPIISLKEYQRYFSKKFILITPYAEKEIESELLELNIEHFFRLSDCPSEFSSPGKCGALHRRIISEMMEASPSAIYGRSFYALLLCYWYWKATGKYVSVYLPEEISDRYLCDLYREFPTMPILPVQELQQDVHTQNSLNALFITDEWDLPHLQANYGDKLKLINAFDITDREKSYFNPILLRFKDIHRGESCFIVGLGPSLRADDLTRIEESEVISFSMNAVNKIFDKTKWRPTYYVITDHKVLEDVNISDIENICKEYSFISDVVQDFWGKHISSRTIKFHGEKNICRREQPKFSTDISKVIRAGATVTYACIQIAVYMGFKCIYLLGVDNFDPHSKDLSYGHFYKEDKLTAKGFTYQTDRAYKRARNYADEHGLHIYNATRGGYLEFFDRIDFDSLFKDGKFMPELGVIDYRPSE